MPEATNGAAAGAAAETTTNTAVTPPAAAAATEDGTRAAAAPEGARISRFSGTSAMAFVESARAFGETVVTRAKELIAQNEKGEISVETATSTLLLASAEAQRAATGSVASGGQAITVTADARDKMLTGIENSIIARAGLADLITRGAKTRGVTIDLDPGEYRGVRNAELARICLERAGVRVSTYDRDQIVGLALTHVGERAGPMNTTSDFATALENVMHKTLQAAYAVQPDTWSKFCGIGQVVDFRPHPQYLLGTFGTLDSLTEDGQFKNKNIPDAAKESITAGTKGNIVALSRQAIVNDDLGAFNTITVELGRAAKLSIEVDVYAVLAQNSGLGPNMNDTVALFDAAHNNIGTPAAPGVAPFDEIRQLMAKQKDVSGNEYLDIRPAILLCPIGLGGSARVINGSLYDPDAANKLQRPNMVNGLFENIVDTPRLTGTRYYAFADKDLAPAIKVVFLNGVQEPYLEQRLGWRTDGTEYKVRHDYGVGGVNWRSAVTNAGA